MNQPLPSNLFCVEEILENAFRELLLPVCKTIFITRESDDLISPRLELKIITGATMNHGKILPGETAWVWDAWDVILRVRIVTNRESDIKSLAHHRMLGAVRARLQVYTVHLEWKQSCPYAITDIRETGTADSFEDENLLDYSDLEWQVITNIKPDAWPETFQA